MSYSSAPNLNRGKLDKTVTEAWWGEGNDLCCGRVSGRIANAGWRWKVSSKGAIWLWLNREGSGLVWGAKDRFILKPGMYAMTGGGQEAGDWSCVRYPGMHTLEVVVISREWLRDRLGKNTEWLHPELGKWLRDGGSIAFCGLMGIWDGDCFLAPTEINEAVRRAWTFFREFFRRSNRAC